MGQLVFQATLGGQVNLVGPNTASTFNINVPAVAGNMVTTGDTGTVTSTMLATSVYTAPGTIGSGTPNSGAFTTLSASSTVSGTGFSTYLASPPAIGGTTAAAGTFTTLTGSTSVTTPIVKSASSLTLQSNGTTTAVTIDTSQNVGIGTTSPSTKLDVNGSITIASTGAVQFGAGFTNYISGNSSSQFMQFATNGSERMRIDSSGNLLVGTTSNPAGVKLVIGGTSGTARVEPVTDNVGYIGEGTFRWQAIYAVNGTIQTSDGREKNTIQDSNLGLSFVQSLRPVSYKWNVGENIVTYDEEGKEVVTPRPGIRTHYGFIAQEVKAAIPDGVDFGGFVQEPNEGMMSLRYHEFIGPLVKAIQEQQALITAQAETINALTARVVALEAK